MMKNVNSVVITKNIARTGSITYANIAEGEVVVLDKNKNIITTTSNADINLTDVIYIARGYNEVNTITLPDGTTQSRRKLIVSAPIQGRNIQNVTSKVYTAAQEKVAKIAFSFTPVTNAVYALRLSYRDLYQHPGLFSYTYRVTATSTDTVTTIAAKFAALINKHKDTRVAAVASTTNLTLTGLNIPNESVNAIDEYDQVNFTVFLYSENLGTSTITYNDNATGASALSVSVFGKGYGTPKLVRDREKHAMSYRGITNRVHFPVIIPDFTVDMSAAYNTIIITANNEYLTPDNQKLETTPISVEIYCAESAATTGTNASQTADIVAKLNNYFASTEKFPSATIVTTAWKTFLS